MVELVVVVVVVDAEAVCAQVQVWVWVLRPVQQSRVIARVAQLQARENRR
jgi:hypothetical protein